MEENTERKVVGEIGVTMEGREEYVGTHHVRVVSYNGAFGLMNIFFVEKNTIVQCVAVNDRVHEFFWDLVNRQKMAMNKTTNNFTATIIKDDDRFYECVNHCGLEVTELSLISPVISHMVSVSTKVSKLPEKAYQKTIKTKNHS